MSIRARITTFATVTVGAALVALLTSPAAQALPGMTHN